MTYKINGLQPSPPDPRDYRVVYGALEKAALPEEWEPDAPDFVIHNQGQINSCVGHAIAAAYEIKGNPKMSFGWVYGNRRHTDYTGEGMITRDALKGIQKEGIPTLAEFPYDKEVPEIITLFEEAADRLLASAQKYRIGPYYRLETPEEVRRAMFEGKGVLLGLFLLDGMIDMQEGTNPKIVPPSFEEGEAVGSIGGHLVAGWGYKKDWIKIPNSWDKEWGDNGFGYVSDELFTWSEEHGFPVPLVEAWGFEFGTEPIQKESGWYQKDGKWRYFDGKQDVVGWTEDGNYWYYLDIDGNMVTGWQKIAGEWYFFQNWGGMVASGWVKTDGWWYYLGEDGKMLTGYQKIGTETFWLNDKPASENTAGIPLGACVITDSRGNILHEGVR